MTTQSARIMFHKAVPAGLTSFCRLTATMAHMGAEVSIRIRKSNWR